MSQDQTAYPRGWNEERLQRVLTHYESQTEDEAVVEDESAFDAEDQTTMEVPSELVPIFRGLIAMFQKKARA